MAFFEFNAESFGAAFGCLFGLAFPVVVAWLWYKIGGITVPDKLALHCDDCPKKGDTFSCVICGMSIVVTKDCACDDPECVSLACCGQAMCKQ